jgi:hypothetical protein
MRIFTFIILLVIALTGINSANGNYIVPDNQTGQVSIYPNPVSSGSITISSDQKIEKIEILNILGQIVRTEEFDSIFSYKMSVDLQPGIYLVKVSFKNNTYSTKRIRVN